MKKIKAIALFGAAMVALLPATTFAQKKGDTVSDYNLKKAYEVLKDDNDEDQAMDLISKQLKETPDNAAAYLLRARLFHNKSEYGNALSDVNQAMKFNKPKKSGIANSLLHWCKAAIYMDMEEYAKASEWYRTALELARKDNPDNVQSISFDYGQSLYDQEKYDEADAVYRQMLKEDETDQAAMVGLARNMFERGEYGAMVPLLKDCMKYDADYSETYRFLAQAYDKLGETDKAIDACMEWFDKDTDVDTDFFVKVAVKHKTYALAKAREKVKKSENPSWWRIALILIYESSFDYDLAIKEYDALEAEYGKDPSVSLSRAKDYSALGLTQEALADVEAAFGKDVDYSAYCEKGDILREAGMYEDAVSSYSEAMELEPMKAYSYYARGWSHELSGDDGKAMEDYNAGIDVDKTFAYIYLMRGELLLKKGEMEAANADFEKVLQLDTVAESHSCTMYALHFLGRDDEAEAWMRKIIDSNPYEIGIYYDQACLYARMGKLDDSVAALEMALKKGYCQFEHIAHDDDMDSIRDREDFKALIAEYSAKLEARISELRKSTEKRNGGLITEVPITRRASGTFEVPCMVNGLSLNMLFDTGASDVTISSVEANFMLKNGLLSKDDVKGKRYYQIADGNLAEGTVVTLKEVKIGDAVLKNVDASVVKSQKAPLLLGQSVMERFGTITIDNINGKLVIKQ